MAVALKVTRKGDTLTVDTLNLTYAETFGLIDNLLVGMEEVSGIARNTILEDLKQVNKED